MSQNIIHTSVTSNKYFKATLYWVELSGVERFLESQFTKGNKQGPFHHFRPEIDDLNPSFLKTRRSNPNLLQHRQVYIGPAIASD
jgi:hypothetical protein